MTLAPPTPCLNTVDLFHWRLFPPQYFDIVVIGVYLLLFCFIAELIGSFADCFQAAAALFSADSPLSSGPIISDITEVATPISEDMVIDLTDAG